MCSVQRENKPAPPSGTRSTGPSCTPIGSKHEPLQLLAYTLPAEDPRIKDTKQYLLSQITEELRKITRSLQNANDTDCGQTANLRKQLRRSLEEIVRFYGRSSASSQLDGLQLETEIEAVTRLSFLRKLRTLQEVETVLSFVNMRRRWAASHGATEEHERYLAYRIRARDYRLEFFKCNNHGSKPISAKASNTQPTSRGRDPLQKDPVELRTHPAPPEPTEVMADMVKEVGRITRKASELQRSMGSGKQSATTEALGIALSAAIEELMGEAKSLTCQRAYSHGETKCH
ncbi:MAG: hypothetical protein LQ346_006557 [Caloplaca aetnensis]|nr:MAG: hypothetical protein LQ346_006557 [Caloplaca aetnensis]